MTTERPTTVAELLQAMRDVVDDDRERRDPRGYFAAMYLGVTRAVQSGLTDGRFTNPAGLERLTVTFANRYLDATRSNEPTAAWAVAFDAAADDDVTVVQHLLLGMNAHINLDLGIACSEVAPGDAIDTIRRDFDEINKVLGQLVGRVQASLSDVSFLYRFVGEIADSEEDAVINFSIGRARAEAWHFAVQLAGMDEQDSAAAIARRDAFVARLGRTIARPPWWSRTGLAVLRFTERTDVRDVIDLFDDVDPTT